jgi:hypothetical protein
MPDLSGESFAAFWVDRAWPTSFDARVRETTGIVLFLNPNELTERQTIDAMNRVLDGLNDVDDLSGAEGKTMTSTASGVSDPETPYSVSGVSAQGGDVRQDRERLLASAPSERVKVVGPELQSEHDLTAPVRWLLAEGGDPVDC